MTIRQENLEDIEHKYYLITTHSNDIITLIEGGKMYMSPSVKHILGYHPEDAHTPAEFILNQIHPEDKERVYQQNMNNIEKKIQYDVLQYRQKHQQGYYIWLETLVKYEYKDNGEVSCILNSRDVTERKLVEEKNVYQAQLLEYMDDAIISLTKDLSIKSWNVGAEQIFNIKKQDAIGERLVDILDIQLYNEKTLQDTISHIYQNHIWKGQGVIKTKAESEHPVFCTFSVMYHLDKSVEGILLICKDLKELHEIQRKLIEKQSHALLEGQEKERKRLARELHDGLGQMLNALKLRINLKEQYTIDEINSLLDDIIIENKRICNNLMPLSLQDFGLTIGMRQLVENFKRLSPETEVDFISNLEPQQRFEPKIEMNLYRILQELLNNILKYAKAQNVAVQITKFEDNVLLMVEDDGIGFDLHQSRLADQLGGYGIVGMKSRIETLKGSLHIDTSPQCGCIVSVSIPIE
jgi:PAS domain S-box-containing protein